MTPDTPRPRGAPGALGVPDSPTRASVRRALGAPDSPSRASVQRALGADRLPVVLTTVDPEPDDEVRALASGAPVHVAGVPAVAEHLLDVLLPHPPSPAPSP